MRNLLSKKFAVNALLGILMLIVVFHLLVISTIIPYSIVWAGKFKSYQEALPFEIVSLLLNVSFIFLVRHRARNIASKIGRIGMWLMFVLFALNTVGNFFAESDFEKYAGIPLTFVLALLSLRLAIQDRKTIPN
jgi:hypothetical protein